MAKTTNAELDAMHHVAIEVRDIGAAVDWYTRTFKCEVGYRDATWALLKFSNISLALVLPAQHPAHIAFSSERAGEFGTLKPHRDGTRSVYVNDPAGNPVEIMDASSI